MGKKSEYKQEAREISDESTNVDIEFQAVPNGYKRTIQHVSAMNESNDFDELRVGYVTQFGVYHWWVQHLTCLDDTLYWMRDARVIQAGDKLVVRFVETVDDDVLVAYVDGFTEELQ